ncbi:MAG: hydroxyacid dehydrogenase [Planctomycetaceae bacterium]|nr:hydroxyacid dehydrogenase [Planctomycetaceae bacterium]
MPKILISENVAGPAINALRAAHEVVYDPQLWKSPELLKAAVVDAGALIIRNQTKVTGELLVAAPQLKIVARAGVGVDNIDIAAATAAGIVVSYTPAANAVSVAELAIGLMLALARNIPAADADTRAGGWNRQRYMGTELAGKTLGVVGFGRIGQMTAERARAFEMKIIAADAWLKPGSPALTRLGATLLSLEALLAEADVVTLHVPLTPETNGLISAPQLAVMKPSAVLINTARGEVIDEPALLAALESRQIAGAALDVRRVEPPGPSPFDQMPNVIVLPHLGAFTFEAQERVVEALSRDVLLVLAGNAAIEYFNFPKPR